MKHMEISRTWLKYEEMVLRGKPRIVQDEAFKGFIAGWASAYAYLWGIVTHPTEDGHKKIVDLVNELAEVQKEVERKAGR